MTIPRLAIYNTLTHLLYSFARFVQRFDGQSALLLYMYAYTHETNIL